MNLTHREALTALTAIHYDLEMRIARIDSHPKNHGLSLANTRKLADFCTELAQPVIGGDTTIALSQPEQRLMVRESLMAYIEFIKDEDNLKKATDFADAYDVEPMGPDECYDLFVRINV